MRDDTLSRLAADVITLLERDGPVVFDRFARAGRRPLRHGGERYQGGNALALWATAEIKGYGSPYWMTFKQALEYKACVRKGEKGTLALYYQPTAPDPADPTDPGSAFAKVYSVFNASQIDGLPPRFFPVVARSEGFDSIPAVQAFVDATGAEVREDQGGAFYCPPDPRDGSGDWIGMPPRRAFADVGAYHPVQLHELVHWSGAPHRLNRLGSAKRYGDDGYAMEELVAEIGSAMLCGDLGLAKTPREDHAHYLVSWLRVLKRDSRALWTAGSAAEKAVAYLHDMQPAAVSLAA